MQITIKTNSRSDFLDITAKVQNQITLSKIKDGLCFIYVPHTTAAVTINESADPDVVEDMQTAFNKLVPWNDGYSHMEGNSAAHIKTTLTGSSELIAIEDGKLLLGRWQGIFFCEFDGPRTRNVTIKIMRNSDELGKLISRGADEIPTKTGI